MKSVLALIWEEGEEKSCLTIVVVVVAVVIVVVNNFFCICRDINSDK